MRELVPESSWTSCFCSSIEQTTLRQSAVWHYCGQSYDVWSLDGAEVRPAMHMHLSHALSDTGAAADETPTASASTSYRISTVQEQALRAAEPVHTSPTIECAESAVVARALHTCCPPERRSCSAEIPCCNCAAARPRDPVLASANAWAMLMPRSSTGTRPRPGNDHWWTLATDAAECALPLRWCGCRVSTRAVVLHWHLSGILPVYCLGLK